jgi:glycosyltransferase involved in cell wall biosynthesis
VGLADNTPTISVVIPTTLRKSITKTISSLLKQEESKKILIEVVVNPIATNKKLLQKLQRNKKIIVRLHPEEYSTAEQSAFHAAATSGSDWIWIIGDDDLAAEGSIAHIINLIENREVDFWLLNCLLDFAGVPLKYYEIGPEKIQIARSFDMWKKLGFLTTLTTLSCFLIRRDVIDLEIFEEFHDIQGVYSHSFSMPAMLSDSLVGVTNMACVIRNEQSSKEIGASLQRYTEAKGRQLDSLWIEGVVALGEKLSKLTKIPFDQLMEYREIEIIKDPNNSYTSQGGLKFLISTTREVAFQRLLMRSEISPSLESTLGPSNPGLIFSGPIRITV